MTLPDPVYPAPAKLNLFLHVVGRRSDGYHLLQTVFTFLDHADRLRFRVRDDGGIYRVNDVSGIEAKGDLAVRAAVLLQRETGCRLGVDIEVEKQLPVGGGLGGGSSDAATTLIALNHLWQTGLKRSQLQGIGLQLGADVPVFVFGRSAFAEGVGEQLQAIDLPALWYLVLCPEARVPTARVFADPELTRDTIPLKMADFSTAAILPLLAQLRNDLEPVAMAAYPEVATYLKALEDAGQGSIFAAGGKNARMTGSGACVFAAFQSAAAAYEARGRLPASLQGIVAKGLDKHPLHDLIR